MVNFDKQLRETIERYKQEREALQDLTPAVIAERLTENIRGLSERLLALEQRTRIHLAEHDTLKLHLASVETKVADIEDLHDIPDDAECGCGCEPEYYDSMIETLLEMVAEQDIKLQMHEEVINELNERIDELQQYRFDHDMDHAEKGPFHECDCSDIDCECGPECDCGCQVDCGSPDPMSLTDNPLYERIIGLEMDVAEINDKLLAAPIQYAQQEVHDGLTFEQWVGDIARRVNGVQNEMGYKIRMADKTVGLFRGDLLTALRRLDDLEDKLKQSEIFAKYNNKTSTDCGCYSCESNSTDPKDKKSYDY